MIEIQAPHPYDHTAGKTRIFLGGSIEMGTASDWQKTIVASMAAHDAVLLNPRRNDWDSSWKQTIDHPQFRQQVEWELQALDDADVRIFYFDPATKAPITLMELGIHAASAPEKVIVCCPEGFWRKGNVDIVCARYGVEQANDLDALIDAVSDRLSA